MPTQNNLEKTSVRKTGFDISILFQQTQKTQQRFKVLAFVFKLIFLNLDIKANLFTANSPLDVQASFKIMY